MRISVVVPMYNEAALVLQTCAALLKQVHPPEFVVFVDNGSTDSTRAMVSEFIQARGLEGWSVLDEAQKGTGAAADSGVRFLIGKGADLIARTDADCLPDKHWLEVAAKKLSGGLDLVTGPTVTRTDDVRVTRFEEKLFNFLPTIARVFGKFRPSNYGNGLMGSYVMVTGCNVAFTADIYFRSGGFPRSKIEDAHEDRALINNVRGYSSSYAYCPEMVVAMSCRRVKAWGVLNTMRWYKNHAYKPEEVDIR